jgi:hypothetical protein
MANAARPIALNENRGDRHEEARSRSAQPRGRRSGKPDEAGLQQLIHEPSVHVPDPHRGEELGSRFRLRSEALFIEAPAEEHDAILLARVAPWAAGEPVSFLRANKPDWRIEVVRPDDDADAVADTALVLHLLALDRDGRLPRSRREMVLRAMRRVTDGLTLSIEERRTLHGTGFRWAVELGRWDETGIAALARRFDELRDGLVALLETSCDAASEARWRLLRRAPGPSDAAIEQARRTISHHANRLGIFAEAEAILHYFLFRLDTGANEA